MVAYIIFHILCIGFLVGVRMEEIHIKSSEPLTFMDLFCTGVLAPFYASVFIGAFICHLGNKE